MLILDNVDDTLILLKGSNRQVENMVNCLNFETNIHDIAKKKKNK